MPDDAMRWGPAEQPATELVVLLHGLGADGADLIDLAPYWSRALPHAAFVAPHAPTHYAEAGFGRQWFSLWDRSPDAIAEGADAARDWIDTFVDAELKRLGLTEYAFMGFSQGAMMALHTGLRRKHPPRAILAFSGRLIAPDRLVEATGHPPILLVHGEADPVVPAMESHKAADALRAAGQSVQTLFIAKLGHGIDDAGLSAGSVALQKAFMTVL
jgi:phospholipase/carboxylesterase